MNVSLDTLREDRFRSITRREGLGRVLEGIHAASAAGLAPVKINMVPIRGVNEDEITEFARLTLRHPWEVRFIEFMPMGEGADFSPEDRVLAPAILEALSRLGVLLPVPREGPAGPARLYHYAGSKGRLGVIPCVSCHFCSECNRLRITADGHIRPCLFSRDEIDLKCALRRGLSRQALENLLRAAIAAKPERHRIGEEDFCAGCRGMQRIGG